MFDTDLVSPNPVNIGILLVICGTIGTFLLEGRFSLVAGLMTGVGAIPVFATTRRDSTRSFGVGTACLLWVIMLMSNSISEVMIGVGVVGLWFFGTANIDSTTELVFDGTVGKKKD